MASWLTPRHLDDLSRVLRGVGLVLARAAADSVQHRASLQQAHAAVAAAASAAASQLQAASAASNVPSQQQAGATVNPLVGYLYPQTVMLQQQQQWQQGGSGPSHHPSTAAAPSPVQHEPPAALQAHASRDQPQQQHQHPQQHAEQVSSTPRGQLGWQRPQAMAAPSSIEHQPATPSAAPAIAAAHLAGSSSSSSSSSSSAATQQLSSAPVVAAEHHQPEPIDSWMSGHESVTTQAEAAQPSQAAGASPSGIQQQQQHQQQPAKSLRERRVPSTQFGRALGFAGMGASLLFGSLTDSISRTLGGSGGAAEDGSGGSGSGGSKGGVYSNFITESNAERLANALCRMRGAALKIGQMLSIQDESVLPPQIQSALERVRAGADVMPRSQLEGQLVDELGRDWGSKVASFDWTPRAAASIGQVHAAVLHDGTQVAMKIQYPGVARSIESDVDNLMRLISIANILPKGLYVENAVKVAKRELALECNYGYEAAAQQRFRQLVSSDPELSASFYVPRVYESLCSRQVLTTEWVNGVTIDKVAEMGQAVRDAVGTQLLRLTLRELYDWRFMQTDPNWGNFLYDGEGGGGGVLNLIDFGAAKEYPREFVDDYLRMVHACAERDRAGVIDMSVALGFLTGDESAVMLDAHTEAGFVVGLPFASRGLYDFGAHHGMTPRVAELGSIMLKHRLTAPPEESYSLHRKLSGAFLACMKLRARVPCRDLFMAAYDAYDFGGGDGGGGSSAAATPGSDAEQHLHTATA